MKKRLTIALFLAIALFSLPAGQGSLEDLSRFGISISPAPVPNARAAILIDAATGAVLYEKNPDLALPPASLAKLVTLHVVMQEIKAGRLSLDELVEIDPRDCSPQIPYGSSLMYLAPGMKVSVRDLMLGAAVVSGNDAAYALARRVAGSNEAFSQLMNKAVLEMGLDRMTFVEPSGLSEKNFVTARQFAQFCRLYIQLHPEALKELHSVKSIEFPRQEHSTDTYKPNGTIIQYNRNPLIFNYEGADGLKTGYIIEVGYNIAATAERNGTRFILVLLGGSSSPVANGSVQRSRDSRALLDWAFTNFATLTPPIEPFKPIRVWFGAQPRFTPIPEYAPAVTIPLRFSGSVSVETKLVKSVKAPVQARQQVGRIIYKVAGQEFASIDMLAPDSIKRGGFLRIVLDSFLRFFAFILGRV